MKNCIGYVRTAIEDDFAIENQINSIRYYANSNNLLVKSIFIDNGKPGTNLNRRGFKQMKEYIGRNKVDVLLIRSISTISRNIDNFSKFYKRLRELGIKIYTTDNQNIDDIEDILDI